MELVMPDGAEASADLAPLRLAYARRLMKRLAERAGRSDVLSALASLHRASPESAYELLLDPTISVCVETDATQTALATLALSLAKRGALGASKRSLAPLTTIASLDANLRARSARALHVSDHTLFVDDVPCALDAPEPREPYVDRPFPAISGSIRLALHDPNPLALNETHPDKEGNALSLGGRSLEAWLDALRTALRIVETHLPGIAAEMHAMLRLVIPVGADDERHLSASYREYVGAVYLTLHKDPMTMAEALVHEFQHNKLNLLSWHYPILENGYDFLYRSPVRPDPRPLMGILLAAHAFVPVAELYQRVLDAGTPRIDHASLRTRLAGVVARNREALWVLESHGRPAPAGALLLARLGTLHARHAALIAELPENVSHVA